MPCRCDGKLSILEHEKFKIIIPCSILSPESIDNINLLCIDNENCCALQLQCSFLENSNNINKEYDFYVSEVITPYGLLDKIEEVFTLQGFNWQPNREKWNETVEHYSKELNTTGFGNKHNLEEVNLLSRILALNNTLYLSRCSLGSSLLNGHTPTADCA
jgi:hypothetical protein